MDNPQVIAEIDALIDSYNWAGARTRTEEIDLALALKQSLRDPYSNYGLWGDISSLQPMYKFVLLQAMLKLLEFPLRNKEWCLQIVQRIPLSLRPQSFWHGKLDRLFHSAMPLFYRFLHHHKASYRIHAAEILIKMNIQVDQVVEWLLARVQREPNLYVRQRILYSLQRLVTQKRFVSTKTRAMVIAYSETLSKAKEPTACLMGVFLYVTLSGHRTPAYILERMDHCWSRLKITVPDGWLAEEFLSGIQRYQRSPILRYQIARRLSAFTKTSRGIDALLSMLMGHHSYKNQCLIAMTRHQKRVLENALACRAFWSDTNRKNFLLKTYGFAPTRSALRQQLRQARLIDDDEVIYTWNSPDYPLQLNTSLLHSKD